MNAELLALLRCPRCLGPLDDPGEPSGLRCPGCAATYPVTRGIPRFAGESYAASFGRQWNRYDVARDEEDAATFAVKTGFDPGDLAGKLVLDAGCGGGRYARLTGRHGAWVVGVDLSSAVEKAAALCVKLSRVSIVQADLLDLPLAERRFDLAFSIGVLHHSPDPRRAFAQVAARVKPGGRLAVWLYRRNTPPQEWLNSALRAATTRLPARVLEPLCRARPARRRPDPEPDSEQGRQLLQPPRLDPPRLRHLRLVRAALPVTPHPRGAAALVRRGGLRRPDRCSPRPARAGSTPGPTATTSSSAAASTSPAPADERRRLANRSAAARTVAMVTLRMALGCPGPHDGRDPHDHKAGRVAKMRSPGRPRRRRHAPKKIFVPFSRGGWRTP